MDKPYHLVFLKDGTNYVCQCKTCIKDHEWRKKLMPDLADKQIRVKGDTHLLVDKLTDKLNKAKVYPTTIYNGDVVTIAVCEYAYNHPDLQVKVN